MVTEIKLAKRNLFHRRGEIIIYRNKTATWRNQVYTIIYLLCLSPLPPSGRPARGTPHGSPPSTDWIGPAPSRHHAREHPQAAGRTQEILDKTEVANFNTVLFQTRTRGAMCSTNHSSSLITPSWQEKPDGNPGCRPACLCRSRSECQ